MAGVEKIGEGTDTLEVELSEKELLEFGDRLARLQAEEESQAQAFDAVKRSYKAQEAELKAKRAAYSLIVARRSAPREVPVEHWADWGRNVRWTVRLDTGGRYAERPLGADERQRALDVLGEAAGVRP